jgi:hypothetical protein
MTRNFVGLLALLLALVACAADNGRSANSGDEPTASTKPSADASTGSPELTAEEKTVVAGLEQAMNSEDELGSSNSTCLATGYVDRLGIAWLQVHGMLRDDLSVKQTSFEDVLSEKDANTFVDVWLSCVDYKSIVANMVGGDAMPTTDPYVVQCVSAVTEADVHEAFVALYSDQDFHRTPFAEKLEKAGCGYEGD